MDLGGDDDRVGRGDEGVAHDGLADITEGDTCGESFAVVDDWFVLSIVYVH